MHKKSGFTLIELLVVIVIIGILTAAATTNYLSAQTNARDNARKAEVNNLSNAVETYYAVNKKFPGKLNVATDSKAANMNPFLNCEQYDGANNYFYFYYPIDPQSTDGTSYNSPCTIRNNATLYTEGSYTYNPADYSPNPVWIPGLGPYTNPMPIDRRYQGPTGTATGLYAPLGTPQNFRQDVLNAVDSGNATALARTIVYRKLVGGYMIYTRLESPNVDSSAYDGRPLNQGGNGTIVLSDQPNYASGNIAITGKNIYIVRK